MCVTHKNTSLHSYVVINVSTDYKSDLNKVIIELPYCLHGQYHKSILASC